MTLFSSSLVLFPFQNDTSREQEIMEPLALECSNEVAGAGEKSMVPEVKGLITKTLEDACCCRDALCAQHGIKLEQIDRIIRSTAVSESKRVKRESETPIISMSRKHCYGWINDGDEHDVVKDTRSVETMEIADLVDLGGGRKWKASNYEILLELWKSFQ